MFGKMIGNTHPLTVRAGRYGTVAALMVSGPTEDTGTFPVRASQGVVPTFAARPAFLLAVFPAWSTLAPKYMRTNLQGRA